MSSTFWVIVTLVPAVSVLYLKSATFLSLKTFAPEPVLTPPVISPVPVPDEVMVTSVAVDETLIPVPPITVLNRKSPSNLSLKTPVPEPTFEPVLISPVFPPAGKLPLTNACVTVSNTKT